MLCSLDKDPALRVGVLYSTSDTFTSGLDLPPIPTYVRSTTTTPFKQGIRQIKLSLLSNDDRIAARAFSCRTLSVQIHSDALVPKKRVLCWRVLISVKSCNDIFTVLEAYAYQREAYQVLRYVGVFLKQRHRQPFRTIFRKVNLYGYRRSFIVMNHTIF